jgi:hypothetical protein
MAAEAKDPIEIGTIEDTAEVELAPDLVPLLSDQLYQSPLKAIEELVVNSYDADAADCFISILPKYGSPLTVAVADDGFGMDGPALKSLWHVGRSAKRTDEYLKRVHRKQIGKFGIGKLAAYSIARVITYYTKADDEVRHASLNFGAFQAEKSPVVKVPIYRVATGSEEFRQLVESLQLACVVPAGFFDRKTWTVCVLSDLKEKAAEIRLGRLDWVLRTAMPLESSFQVHLNGKRIASAKETLNRVIELTVPTLPPERIAELAKRIPGLKRDGDRLVSDALPSGVTFSATVYEQTLSGGKAEDLGRSHGFFIKVRGRLINERDELFGISLASYKTWYRFKAVINADDLDVQITASRESLEESASVREVRLIAAAIYLESRVRFEAWSDEKDKAARAKREEGRNPVSPRLVEMPVADAVRRFGTESSGADADTNWFYLDLEGEDAEELSSILYGPREGVYSYRFDGLGQDERIVKFHARDKLFVMNEDHPLIREYTDGDRYSIRLLQDFVTAEALLEVNLRQANVPLKIIGEILQTRDKLIRSLARDEIYSLKSVADELRKAFDDQYDLEISLVASARALGLIAKHVGGTGKPDGIARYIANNGEETKITLEAKSSQTTPSLAAIDFAGVSEHIKNEGASGCLLVAPSYPGTNRADDAAAAKRAEDTKCSCWTVDQLASVVEAAEAREISARDVLDIILKRFTPDSVSKAVSDLLSTPNGHRREVYTAVVDTMEAMLHRPVLGKALTIDLLAGRITGQRDIEVEEVAKAVKVVAEASRGLIQLRDTEIVVLGSFEELRRRLGSLISGPVSARRLGDFRDRN